MFRAIYNVAAEYTTIKGADGQEIKSPSFPIRHRVVQGDVTSPLFFIIALELLLRRHDAEKGKGVPLDATLIHTLGYADDIALIESGDYVGLERWNGSRAASSRSPKVHGLMLTRIFR